MQKDKHMELARMAREVLLYNRKVDRLQPSTTFTCPSKGWYDHQWLWDSCFHAIALRTFDPEAAKQELQSLVAGIRHDGFLPNVIMHHTGKGWYNTLFSVLLFSNNITNITQPPVVAVALEEVYKTTKDKAYVTALLPAVKRYFDYLRIHRDPEQSHLISVIHPWDTGIDATPSFDPLLGIRTRKPTTLHVYTAYYELLLRYALMGWNNKKLALQQRFNVKHVMFNAIYCQGLRALSRLCKEMGETAESIIYDHFADLSEHAILTKCWDEQDGLFYDLAPSGQLRTPTTSSLFPLLLDNIPQPILDRLVNEHLLNPEEFWTPYPLATVPRNHKTFCPEDSKTVLWRGPVWINANWFLIRALQKHGYSDVAQALQDKTIELLLRNDTLYVFYNPLTGAGQGQKHFSWTALILDLLNQQPVEQVAINKVDTVQAEELLVA